MSDSPVFRCNSCGGWVHEEHVKCLNCGILNSQTTKGDSNAESNQRRSNMVGARESSKGK